jgi:trans-aconitate 2-methyltransferase
MVREWDAATYDRVADPQARWGRAVVDRLDLQGDERVLDAGCGSGRVTEYLLSRLPKGRVVALDASAAMLDEARRRLASDAARVDFVLADLGAALPIQPPVDAILSTATFHWVPDHDALFGQLAAIVRAGGRLAAQFGGAGNIASIRRALKTIGDGWLGPAHYETVEATAERLERAGFIDIQAWLQPEPTRFEPGEPFERFLSTVVLGPQLARLPPDSRPAFVRRVVAQLPAPEIDYVRLNIVARRAGGPAT